jgi:alpha-glucosidase (family GH31 glycosyl hydrolase)
MRSSAKEQTVSEQNNSIDMILLKGGTLRIEMLAAHTFRIRLSADGRFGEPALNRYGILRREWPSVACEHSETPEAIILRTAEAQLTVNKADGRLTLADAAGKVLTHEATPAWSRADAGFGAQMGFGAEYTLADGERLYGLGDETRETVQKRGHLARMWVANVACYVPIPFLMSTSGWAVFLNTTWRHSWDVGHARSDRLRFSGPRGELDYYLFVGPDLPSLLDRYTDLTGKPHILPYWGYGLTFVCNQQADAREMLDDALNFRREGIPCDLIGLEPGWMEKYYDFSVEKKWHPERFYLPYWSTKGPHTFLGAAERLGFKMSLWLCCDYDLSHEEEREAKSRTLLDAPAAQAHADDFEQDKHLGMAIQMDKITKPDEPWFEHLKQFVDQGVWAFKLDGANQIADHPDRRWANGLSDEEMHNLYPTLLNKQMHRGFKAHTGRRAMVYSSGGYAGIQQFSATWAGDTGGGPKPLVSMLNHGLSGHVNVSCDMDVFTPAGIHFGFLQAWSQVCSWAYWRHPWLLGDTLLPIFKYYADLRYRLLPYIYSQAHVAARTGLPIMRAMPLAFGDDPQADALIHQYMLGDAFLTAAFEDKIHLPRGRWIDYWTGETYEGPADIEARWPADRGGPLFVRGGAIIPYGPLMDYIGQKPVDALEIHVYPDGESAFTLYEDDGVSYAYLDGAVARTVITCRETAGHVTITIGAREGRYDGMPQARCYNVHVHVASAPQSVSVDGQPVDWRYDSDARTIIVHTSEDPDRGRATVIACHW